MAPKVLSRNNRATRNSRNPAVLVDKRQASSTLTTPVTAPRSERDLTTIDADDEDTSSAENSIPTQEIEPPASVPTINAFPDLTDPDSTATQPQGTTNAPQLQFLQQYQQLAQHLGLPPMNPAWFVAAPGTKRIEPTKNKLQNKNQFQNWETEVKIILETESLWDLSADLPLDNNYARLFIRQSIDDDVLLQVNQNDSAPEMIRKLRAVFDIRTQITRGQDLQKIFTMTFSEDPAKFSEELTRGREIAQRCDNDPHLKATFENLFALSAICRLPASVGYMRNQFQADKVLSDPEAINKIQQSVAAELSIVGGKPSLNSEPQNNLLRGLATSDPKEGTRMMLVCKHQRVEYKCWICHPHLNPHNKTCNICNVKMAQCRCKKRQIENKGKHPNKHLKINNTSRNTLGYGIFAMNNDNDVENQVNKSKIDVYSLYSKLESLIYNPNDSKQLEENNNKSKYFILDSGAHRHICQPHPNLFNIRDPERDSQIVSASGDTIPVSAVADLTIQNGNSELKLKDVLVCEGVHGNLISVGKLCEEGIITVFGPEQALLIWPDNTTANFQIQNGHYTVNAFSSSEEKMLQWHRRLNHANPQMISKLKKITDIPVGTVSKIFCPVCIKSKMSFKRELNKSTSSYEIGEVVYSDIGYMPVETNDGHKCYVLFIDHQSRFIVGYPLKSKGEVASAFNHYVNKIHCFINAPRKCFIRTDNALEYKSNEFDEICGSRFVHEYSCDYHHYQMGMVERPHQSLRNSIISSLTQSGLGNEYWNEALFYAIAHHNISPHPSIESTPFKMWNNKPFDYSKTHSFGCIAYVRIPEEKRVNKLSHKAEELIFIGYPENSRGLIFLDTSSGRRVYSDNYLFPQIDRFIIDKSQSNSSGDTTLDTENPPSTQSLPEINLNNTPSVVGDENAQNEIISPLQSNKRLTKDDSGISHLNIQSGKRTRTQRLRVLAVMELLPAPEHFRDIEGRPDSSKWFEAIDEEIGNMAREGVWKEKTTLPEGQKLVGCRWVFTYKFNSDGSIAKYKARLVARGFSQIEGEHYDETYSPVVQQDSFRMFLIVAAIKGLKVRHGDVTAAYLAAKLDKQIFMKLPDGYKPKCNSSVLELIKAIYGLKQSGRLWYLKIDTWLKQKEFTTCPDEPCLYRNKGKEDILIALYVDDLLIATKDDFTLSLFIKDLGNFVNFKDLGEVSYCLGTKIERDWENQVFVLSNPNHIKKAMLTLGIESKRNQRSIPMKKGTTFKEDNVHCTTMKRENEYHWSYRSIMGMLQFICRCSRPDIGYAVSTLSSFLAEPQFKHLEAVKDLTTYLKSTINYGLVLGGKGQDIHLNTYVDASFAMQTHSRSQMGYVLRIGDSPMTWKSTTLKVHTQSTCETEVYALANAANHMVYFERILAHLGHPQAGKMVVYEDNQSCINAIMAKGNVGNLKHVNIKGWSLHGRFAEQKDIILTYCQTKSMIADTFTKALGREEFISFRKKLRVLDWLREKGDCSAYFPEPSSTTETRGENSRAKRDIYNLNHMHD